MKTLALCLMTFLLCGSIATQAQSASQTDAEPKIRSLLMSMFDKPDARLTVGPIVSLGNHAIASWNQGKTGGRALLRRHGEQWNLVACGGDAFKEEATLRDAGIPREDAARLVRQLTAAETKIPADRRKLFSLFGPTVDAKAMHGTGSQHPH